MAFALTSGNHEYWYDPDKKEFVLTLFKYNEDGKDRSYIIRPDNIVQAATMLDEYGDEDFSLYDMLKFLKDNNVMDDYASVAKELAERYSDQPPVWLDDGNIDSALGLIDSSSEENSAENSAENKKTLKFGPKTEVSEEDYDAVWDNIPGSIVEEDEVINGETGVDDGDILFNAGRVYDSVEDEWIGPIEWLKRREIDYKNEEPESTNLGDIAKALTANDLGRSL